MKILMLSTQPFFEPRGTPISVYQRLEALSALGHHIDLITYHVGKDVDLPNVTIHRVRKVDVIRHVRIGPSRAKILLDVLVFLKALGMMLKTRYDVIHTHEEAAFFGMFLARLFRTHHLYDMHSVLSRQLKNFDFGNHPVFIKIFEILEKMAIRSSASVITIASDLEAYVRAVAPRVPVMTIENTALQAYSNQVTPGEVEALMNSLNLHGRVPVVYAGTYERYQGLDMAMEAVDLVRRHYPNVIFLFVGAKNLQGWEMTEKAKEMDLADHTLFLDVVPPEESMIFLGYGAVLISPRLAGTATPLKVYSYLYAGRPIVATNILAHTTVLDESNAVLVEPTPEALAEGILRVLHDPQLAESLGKNAYQTAREKFNYQIYLGKVRDVYQRLALEVMKLKPAYLREP